MGWIPVACRYLKLELSCSLVPAPLVLLIAARFEHSTTQISCPWVASNKPKDARCSLVASSLEV